jgi:hypothetical protein
MGVLTFHKQELTRRQLSRGALHPRIWHVVGLVRQSISNAGLLDVFISRALDSTFTVLEANTVSPFGSIFRASVDWHAGFLCALGSPGVARSKRRFLANYFNGLEPLLRRSDTH